MLIQLVATITLGMLVLTGSPAYAGVDQALLCKEKKAKAAGKKAFDLLKAFGKNTKKTNTAKLDQDISKAHSKFTKGFTKAEAKGLCLTSGDSDDIKAKVDAFVGEVISGLSCGDGNLDPGEQCDDGNTEAGDGCDGRCLLEETAEGIDFASTDDEGDGGTPDGAHPDDAVETTVETTVDDPATIFIRETSTTVVVPPGYVLVDTQVEITFDPEVPPSASDPLRLMFFLDASLEGILQNIQLELIQVFRDGTLAGQCADPGVDVANPDPCVKSKVVDGESGDVTITVLTTEASVWTFGFPLFVDNGDGTITDNQTGLMWEKKDDNNVGGIHDKNNLYTWAGCCDGFCGTADDLCQPNTAAAAACSTQTGGAVGCAECSVGTCDVDPWGQGTITTIWDWLVQLNAAGFGGHNDWRIPEVSRDGGVEELETILLESYICGTSPCVDSVFNTDCTPGCTVTTCSCTESSFYWSSTTGADTPDFAWNVNFYFGDMFYYDKFYNRYVRAVRGGS